MQGASFSNAVGALGRRLCSYWRLKCALAALLSVSFCVPYFLLMYFPLRPMQAAPTLWLDEVVSFDPRWVWVYQSVYLPINLLPWLADRREQLWRFAIGFLGLCVASFAVFLFYPTQCPRPIVTDPQGMYWLLLLYDRPNNAFPSLHAGLLVYTLLFVRRVMCSGAARPLLRFCFAVLVVWATLILYAILATKEHYALDVLAGAALAVVADRLAWSSAVRISAVSRGRMSHAG